MATKLIHHPIKALLWLSDLHLDRADAKEKFRFFEGLKCAESDGVLITGDVSTACNLGRDLGEVAVACGSRPVMFVLGNHDYYGSSFADVEKCVARACSKHRNLVALGHGEIIALSRTTALVGHQGWFDGRAGAGQGTMVGCPDPGHRVGKPHARAGQGTMVGCPDRHQISDFGKLDRKQFFEKLDTLGRESARYFRHVLPKALSRYGHVLIATHVPTFTQALRYSDGYCDWDRQPYFSNRAAGNAIWGISQKHPTRNISVYAGHSHSPVSVLMAHNLTIHVAAARHGNTELGRLLTIR